MAEYMGEYNIIRRMDGGGNANVFVAKNARGEEVAIKILREESGNGKRTEKRNRKKRIRFKIETEMVVGIQDEIEGVIPIFSYGLPDKRTKKYWDAMPIAILFIVFFLLFFITLSSLSQQIKNLMLFYYKPYDHHTVYSLLSIQYKFSLLHFKTVKLNYFCLFASKKAL